MMSGRFRFDRFLLDPADRRLLRDGAPVELNARYLDALALLVRESGALVSKDRFLDEVWRGVPVTDEALTQCIKTLRKQLGDDAARPRFIETVPKHGYRFIAAVERAENEAVAPPAPTQSSDARRRILLLGAAGILGAGLAGLIGGLCYGLVGAAQAGATGAISTLLVLTCLTLFVALVGAAGGLIVGAVAKLLGLDAFNLLLGQTPGDITGAAEGALIGGSVGMGAWLGGALSLRRGATVAALCGGGAGLIITLLDGRMMGGSLDLLARQFPGSRFRLDQIGALFGETGFGPVSQAVTGVAEGALFAVGVVAAMILARRSL
jgi:DNA-binding winged helix-turn-helix (wHTH) protein